MSEERRPVPLGMMAELGGRPVVVERGHRRVTTGFLWGRPPVYQFGGEDWRRLVHWENRAVAFGPDEWLAVRRSEPECLILDRNDGTWYVIGWPAAQAEAHLVETPRGPRWMVALEHWAFRGYPSEPKAPAEPSQGSLL